MKILEEPLICASRGRNLDNPSDRTAGADLEQRIEVNEQGASNTLTSVQKDNLVVEPLIVQNPHGFNKGNELEISPTITTSAFENNNFVKTKYRIRKLTPKECIRLMDFDDSDYGKIKAIGMSDSQIYKQCGNSIVVACLQGIFRKMFIDTEVENEQLSLF